MQVYMAVTPDEYELPLHIEDSVKNLSITWRIQKNANKSNDLVNSDTQGWRVNFKENWDRTTSLLKLSGEIVNIRLVPKEIGNAKKYGIRKAGL